jgi:hypothetical protein
MDKVITTALLIDIGMVLPSRSSTQPTLMMDSGRRSATWLPTDDRWEPD